MRIYLVTLLIFTGVVAQSAAGEDPVLLGQWRGDRSTPASAVALFGHYACIAGSDLNRQVLQVFDLSDPRHPQFTSEYVTNGSRVTALATTGNYVLVGNSRSNLVVFDLSQPNQPVPAATVSLAGAVKVMAISGNQAYLALNNPSQCLKIVDLLDPSHPRVVGSAALASASGVAAMAILSNYVYLAGTDMWGTIFDASLPGRCTQVGTYGVNASSLTVAGQYAYAVNYPQHGMVVLDLSQPLQPQRVPDTWGTNRTFSAVAVAGNLAYLTTSSSSAWWPGFTIIDVADAAHPRLLGQCDTSASSIMVAGRYAYLAGNTGLQVVDVSDPTKPSVVWPVAPGTVYGVAVSGDYAYLADGPEGLVVLDIHDPMLPKQIGMVSHGRYVEAVALKGHYACLIGGGELAMADISEPSHPKWAGHYFTSARTLTLAGDYALVSGSQAMDVIDIVDPANPRQIGSLATWYDSCIATRGELAYVARDNGSLLIVDISLPMFPVLVGAIDPTPGVINAGGLAVRDGYAYLAWGLGGQYGLWIIDVRNPAHPRLAGTYGSNLLGVNSVAVSGNRAFLAERSGLEVLDISTPTALRRVGIYNGPTAYAVAMNGNRAFVAAGPEGLLILQLAPAPPLLNPTPRMDAAGLHLFFEAPAGQNVRLQRSSDLTAWTDWQVLTGTGGVQEAIDTGAIRKSQFYRILTP